MLVKHMGAIIGNELDCKPMFEDKEIIIGIDSSKTNTGISVTNLTDSEEGNEVETSFAFYGKDDGTTEQDCLLLCKKEREAFRKIFKGSYIRVAGIEDIITKEYSSNPYHKTGMTVHESRFKITAVFGSFISCLQEDFGKTPFLVNNWSWKAAMLPPEYRAKGVYKGSQLYLQDKGSIFGDLTDDETDAYFIKKYCYRYLKNDVKELNSDVEKFDKDYGVTIVDKSFIDDFQVFMYNPQISFDDNCRLAISNAVSSGNHTRTVCLISDISNLPLQVLWYLVDDKYNLSSQAALIKINY